MSIMITTEEATKMIRKIPIFLIRILGMVLGIIMMGTALAILMKLELGTDPYACFILGLSKQLQISYGNCHLLVQLTMFIIVVYFDKNMIGLGTIGNMIFLGYVTDINTYLLDLFVPTYFWENTLIKFIILLPSMIGFVVGAALYMGIELGVSPYDGIPFILTKTFKKAPFKRVRILWDFIFLFLGYLLGGTVGIVTLLCVCFIGPTVTWIRKKIDPYLKRNS